MSFSTCWNARVPGTWDLLPFGKIIENNLLHGRGNNESQLRARGIYGIILQKVVVATWEANNMSGETIKIEFELPCRNKPGKQFPATEKSFPWRAYRCCLYRITRPTGRLSGSCWNLPASG
jgi:hypothetical protein